MANWRPMKSAPTDGTMVIVLETPNGEHFNVLPAMYMNYGGGDPRLGENPVGLRRWWAFTGSRRTGEGGDCSLPVRVKPLASTPIAWQPMPDLPDLATCRRKNLKYWRDEERIAAAAKPSGEESKDA